MVCAQFIDMHASSQIFEPTKIQTRHGRASVTNRRLQPCKTYAQPFPFALSINYATACQRRRRLQPAKRNPEHRPENLPYLPYFSGPQSKRSPLKSPDPALAQHTAVRPMDPPLLLAQTDCQMVVPVAARSLRLPIRPTGSRAATSQCHRGDSHSGHVWASRLNGSIRTSDHITESQIFWNVLMVGRSSRKKMRKSRRTYSKRKERCRRV